MIWYISDVRNLSHEEYEEAYRQMDETKRMRVDRMRQKKDRLRSVAGDSLARSVLSRELKCSDTEITFTYDENGKPRVKGNPLFFSLSHSEDLVACAVSKNPIGVDIEQIRDVSPRLARKYFTEEEQEYLFGHAPKDVDWDGVLTPPERLRFFEIWTAKEAYLKCIGKDLSHLRSFNTLNMQFERHLLKEDYILTIYQEHYSLF